MKRVAAAVVLVAATTLSGCAAPPKSQPGPVSRSYEVCTGVENLAQALWDPKMNEEEGYGESLNLLKPDFYWTAWNLRTLGSFDLRFPGLSTRRAAQYLMESALDGSSDIRSLEATHLAVEAAKASGHPVPVGTVATMVHRFKSGRGYSWEPNGAVDDAATMIAIATLSSAGAPIDPSLHALTSQSLDGFEDINEIVEVGIPRLVASAFLTEPTDLSRRKALGAYGRAWQLILLEGAPSPFALSSLYWIKRGLAFMGEEVPHVRGSYLNALMTKSGYITVAPGEESPDPQATFYALSLSGTIPARLHESMKRRMTPMGWIIDTTTVDLPATTHVIGALATCDAELPPFPEDIVSAGFKGSSDDRRRSCAIVQSYSRSEESVVKSLGTPNCDQALAREKELEDVDYFGDGEKSCDARGICGFGSAAKPDILATSYWSLVNGDGFDARLKRLKVFADSGFFSSELNLDRSHANTLTLLAVALMASGDRSDISWIGVL